MSKYNYEFKKKIVMSYRNVMGSYKNLVKLHKIPSDMRIHEQVRIYNSFEDEGLTLYDLKRKVGKRHWINLRQIVKLKKQKKELWIQVQNM